MNRRITGLEEKFRVHNNDEIADALHDRITKLSLRSESWIPEALSLLLHLSDQPIQNSRLEDLELLKPGTPPVELTWADILAEDPLDNQDGLWDDVNFAATDSEKESEIVDEDSDTPGGSLDSLDEADDFDASRYELSIDDKLLEDSADVTYWSSKKFGEDYSTERNRSGSCVEPIKLTEAQLIREVIFLLLGLPSPISRPTSKGSLSFDFLKIQSEHMSQDALMHLLLQFANAADSLAKTRTWMKRVETVTLLQAFQAGLNARMNVVEVALSDIQSRILNPSCRSHISLLDLFNEVCLITTFMQQIAAILIRLQSIAPAHLPIQLLEHLHDETCLYHSIGDEKSYLDMARFFFECLHIYLKPVQAWMEFGELSKNEETFFVRENPHDVAPERLWQEQYLLVENEASIIQAPEFLQIIAKKIFTTGKSVSFLKRLGRFNPDRSRSLLYTQTLDCEITCQQDNNFLLPFSALLETSLKKWIADGYQASSRQLRAVLEMECDMKASLDALDVVYFNCNGMIGDDVRSTIFSRIDKGIEAWNDGFLLTELFQRVFGTHPSIDADRLAVRSSGDFNQAIPNQRRSVNILQAFKVWYRLPWPVANIIKPQSIDIYQRISVFLIQIQRAKTTLERQYPMRCLLIPADSRDHQNRLVYCLRHCLLWFINTLLTYVANPVLSAATQEMRHAMANAEDLDEMIGVHEKVIARLEKQCLISKNLAPIHHAVISILDLAITFADAQVSYTTHLLRETTSKTVSLHPHVIEDYDFHQDGKNGKHNAKQAVSDPSLSGSDDEGGGEGHHESRAFNLSQVSVQEISLYIERIKDIQASFTSLVSFVIASLQSVHKAAGEPSWELLANMLVTGLGKEQSYV